MRDSAASMLAASGSATWISGSICRFKGLRLLMGQVAILRPLAAFGVKQLQIFVTHHVHGESARVRGMPPRTTSYALGVNCRSRRLVLKFANPSIHAPLQPLLPQTPRQCWLMPSLRRFGKERGGDFHRTLDIPARYVQMRYPALLAVRTGYQHSVRFQMCGQCCKQRRWPLGP